MASQHDSIDKQEKDDSDDDCYTIELKENDIIDAK
jgi:hypothetical protein